MKPQTLLLTSLLLLAAAIFSTPLSAQQNKTVSLTGAKMRAPLELQQGDNAVSLCNLIPGNTYFVTLTGAAYNQQADFEFASGPLFTDEAEISDVATDRKNALRFKALSECVNLKVKADSREQATTIPMFFSVKCESCPEANAWKEKLLGKSGQSVLEVTTGVSAETLVKDVLIGGDCYDVSNVSYSGQPEQIGTFSNGSSNIGFAEGIILATGDASIAPGPNDVDNASAGFGNQTPDANLSTLTAGTLYDRADIEFDFKPTQTPVTFEFVFASEEYCEYVNTQYNDVFGFFISGPGIAGTKNLAVLPSTNTPISINTVNHLLNNTFYTHNTPFGGNNCNGQVPPASGQAINEVQYDGFTKKLTAVANVVPCQTYHIKLKIADVGDGIYDSGVFLRANSFAAGGSAIVEPVYPSGMQHVFENCDTGYIRFSRSNGDNSQPLDVHFSVSTSSTATEGIDYDSLPNPVVIPAGQNEVLVPVIVHPDTLLEGQESVILLLDNSCACSQTQVQFLIQDNTTMETSLGDQVTCSNLGVTLMPAVSGGIPPYNYLWNTGETTASIHVNPSATSLYSVIITDNCGQLVSDSALVSVQSLIEDSVLITFCPGSTVTIGDSTYSSSTVLTDTLPGINGGCDTIVTYTLTLLPQPVLTDTIAFCPGSSVTIGDSTYLESAVVIDTLPGLNGSCDTIATYVLELLPMPAVTDTIVFCEGSSVTIGGMTYTGPGVVTDTLPGIGGSCDTIATYVLQVQPRQTQNNAIAFCPGGSVTIGGVVYTGPAVVMDTLRGLNGDCDTLVTYTLTLLPQLSLSKTIGFCPGETVLIGGSAYTQPGTVDVVVPGINGDCDTLVTYTLQYVTPAPSTVKITCPPSITISGGSQTIANYNLPVASSDCPCPGIALDLTEGPASGSTFSTGTTKICYTAKDSCGHTASCCFEVNVQETPPCDIKTIACIKYELLSIARDAEDNRTYRIRVTNNCPNKLIYTAFQLPNGVVAVNPPNNSVYVSPAGRSYEVVNPNYSPFYSVRFKSTTDSIANGESDIFEFTLPPFAKVTYIHAIVRVVPQIFYEAHLNTFYCPEQSGPVQNKMSGNSGATPGFSVFPNPGAGTLFADLTDWAGESLELRVFDGQGQAVQSFTLIADTAPQELGLRQDLADGLYFLEISTRAGERQATKFVIRR